MIKDLITNKDIRELKKKSNETGRLTGDELLLLREHEELSKKFKKGEKKARCYYESRLQSYCSNLIKAKYQFSKDSVVFLQIDNGGEGSDGQRRRKAQEGTQSGFKDVIILVWRGSIKYPLRGTDEVIKTIYHSKQFFPEFKRIGGVVTDKQLYWHKYLKEKGESAYFCNNSLFFEKIIMKEIEGFLK